MANKLKEGPLSLLAECYRTQQRVKVVTRHISGVRGWCTGRLQGFDKYINLVLKDVEEQYTVLVSANRTIVGKDGKEKLRQGRRQEHRKRKLGQIFVLGSAVVTVSKAC